MENPCKKCITRSVCKGRVEKSLTLFISWASIECDLYKSYIKEDKFFISIDNVNEIGKIFGYELIMVRGRYLYKYII